MAAASDPQQFSMVREQRKDAELHGFKGICFTLQWYLRVRGTAC